MASEETPTRILRRTRLELPTLQLPAIDIGAAMQESLHSCKTERDIWEDGCCICAQKPDLLLLDAMLVSLPVLGSLLFEGFKRILRTHGDNGIWHYRMCRILDYYVHHHPLKLEQCVKVMFMTKRMVHVERQPPDSTYRVLANMFHGLSPESQLYMMCILDNESLIVDHCSKHLVVEAESHLKCAICLEISTDIVVTTCTHWFCAQCFEQSQRVSSDCPMCRQDTFAIPAERLVAPLREQAILRQETRNKTIAVMIQYAFMCHKNRAPMVAKILGPALNFEQLRKFVVEVLDTLESDGIEVLTQMELSPSARQDIFLMVLDHVSTTRQYVQRSILRLFENTSMYATLKNVLKRHNEFCLICSRQTAPVRNRRQ
jgi:hypothetical protein